MVAVDTNERPNWPEILIGLVGYVGFLLAFAFAFRLLPPNDLVLQGIVGSTAGGFVCVAAFAAACGFRIRALRPFGFKRVSARWLWIAAAVGIGTYGLILIMREIYTMFFVLNDPQGILHAAAQGGPLPFILSFIGGAIFTPFGEEILFRGVIANALNRYGAFAGIVLSAVIFGLAHGVNVVLLAAIVVGITSATLFRATGSIWPCVVLHGVYNSAHLVASASGFSPAG